MITKGLVVGMIIETTQKEGITTEKEGIPAEKEGITTGAEGTL